MTIHSRWQHDATITHEDDRAVRSYNLDQMEADILDLSGLLRVTNEQLAKMDYGSGAARNHELVRILSLSRIACGVAETMVARFLSTHPN